MTSVQIIQVGQGDPGVNLDLVKRMAQRVQRHYHFSIGDRITNLGEPMENGLYQSARLLDVLIDNRQIDGDSICVGITHCQLHDEIMSAVDLNNRAVLITTDPTTTEPFLSRVQANITGYVLFEMAAQLLTIDYRHRTQLNIDPEDCGSPWHKQTKGCVFDYSDVLKDTRIKLIKPTICSECLSHIEEANVSESVLSACKKIINRACHLTISVILQSLAVNPVVSLFVGGILVATLTDWLNDYISSGQIIGLLIIGVLVTVFVLLRRSPSLKM